MSNYRDIQLKLHKFIKKYYTNELIKGVLLFLSIGLMYFIFTLIIEYFLWLKPLARTLLFWVFIFVEIFLITIYIMLPIFKIYGLKNGISEVEASKIIGRYFPEVNDKLLNMLQLQGSKQHSELIEASIDQKSRDLQPIPFVKAVDFSKNKKYLKYALLPIVIWLLVFVTGNINVFNDSLDRVVNYKTAYEPPAPFSFHILNDELSVIEGEPFLLDIEIIGQTFPEHVKIHFPKENYYFENYENGKFKYEFSNVREPIEFYMEANNVISKDYIIKVVPAPSITNLKMILSYPKYTRKRNEVIQNTGNAIVPQGTLITWQSETHQTDSVAFISNVEKIVFERNTQTLFSLSKKIEKSINYRIAASNKELNNYEDLNFDINVVNDEFPKIIVNSNIDSISYGPAHFVGQLSDDYGVKGLQLVYYDKLNPKAQKKHLINVVNTTYTDFYYIFPDNLNLIEGVDYEMYFEVRDNDAVNGSKSTKSKVFSYYNKTAKELNEDLLKDQKDQLDVLSKTVDRSKKINSEMKKFQENLQKKSELNWNDSKKLEQFIKRQEQYDELFKQQTEKLQHNLMEQPVEDELKEKKEDLNKRIEEAKKLAEKEEILKELEELTKKIKKEDLVDKLKDIAKKNKNKEKSLERILELTKRFYVEQKAIQISDKLKKLSEEQDELSKGKDDVNKLDKQKEINKKFDEITTDLNELESQNEQLKRPIKLPDVEDEKEAISEDLKSALEELNKEQNSKEQKENSGSRKKQKAASKKMKEMGEMMEMSMASSGGESIDENIEDLRIIVENLIEFSFEQETLLNEFLRKNNLHPEFAKNLKEQHVLKEHFEHIDDSIYMLSLRLVKMSVEIQKEINEVHYNIDESIENFVENKLNNGFANQRLIITSVNNLANNLSDLLESLLNATPSMGKGKGDSQEFTLPDIIKKQGELSEKMKEGIKEKGNVGDKKDGDEGEKGKKDGNEGINKNEDGDGSNEEMNEELFEIYKEQSKLKQLLKEIMSKNGEKSLKGLGEAIDKMEELEELILEKGFTKEVIEKMKSLNYELLELEEAKKEQGEDEKRNSKTNLSSFEKTPIDDLKFKKLYFNYNEILNRQSLPLRGIYKNKVRDYFKTNEEK